MTVACSFPITMYVCPTCEDSALARERLYELDVPFAEINRVRGGMVGQAKEEEIGLIGNLVHQEAGEGACRGPPYRALGHDKSR